MFTKVKKALTETAWLTLGVTAIAVEESYKAVKDIASEVKAGTHQVYAKWRYEKLCARIECPDSDPLHFHQDGCPTCDVEVIV